MIPALTTPRPCSTGTIKVHPFKRIEGTSPAEYEPRRKEFIPGREGLLIGWGTEGDQENGMAIMGLVEFDDGTFDTFCASCIKLKQNTKSAATGSERNNDE